MRLHNKAVLLILKLDFKNEGSACVMSQSETQLTLLREAGLGHGFQSQPNKAKVRISCKLSPAVAGAGRHGVESRVGRRLNVQCIEKKKSGSKIGKGSTGDGKDQAGVLDEGEVWPRPEELSFATPSCEKVTGLRKC